MQINSITRSSDYFADIKPIKKEVEQLEGKNIIEINNGNASDINSDIKVLASRSREMKKEIHTNGNVEIKPNIISEPGSPNNEFAEYANANTGGCTIVGAGGGILAGLRFGGIGGVIGGIIGGVAGYIFGRITSTPLGYKIDCLIQ
jgi:hypothetical protein